MFIFSLLVSLASAQIGVTADSMGGAGVAGGHPYEAAFLNPAALVEVKAKHFALQSHWNDTYNQPDQKQYSVILTDAGEMTLFPGSLIYRRRTSDLLNTRTREEQIQLSMAAGIATNWAMGVSAYKIKTDVFSGEDYHQYNADLGLYWAAKPSLSFGMVYRGVLGSKEVLWLPSQVIPNVAMGTEYRFLEMFKVRYDLNYFLEQNSDHRLRQMVGAEVRYDTDLVLRAGFSQDERLKQNRWTAGIGWEGPRLKVGYAYQKEYRQKMGEVHSVDMWLDF